MPYPTILSRIKHAFTQGMIVWLLSYWYIHIEYIILFLVDYFWPTEDIDILPDFDSERYKENGVLNYGNHSFKVNEKKHSELNLVDPYVKNQHQQTGSSDHLKAIRLLVGTKEKLIRSEVGSRSLRYQTIRPDKVISDSIATK